MGMKVENVIKSQSLESQEHLSKDLLKRFQVSHNYVLNDEVLNERPASNFIDMMNWGERAFSHVLSDRKNINRFVNNKIVIDGEFVAFCDEKGLKIECIYKDSIISWKSNSDFEKFFVQGVFLIKSENLEFLQFSLFHKGNQNEDEISFFILLSEDNYESYLKLRNEYDLWAQKRDRGNLQIRVMDGDDIPYTRDSTWDNLFLPNDIKSEIKSLVENFLSSKDFYIKNNIPWKRGLLLYGQPGCGKTSIIRTILSTYDFKPVTVIPGATDETIRDAFSYAEDQSPALLYFEDLDSLLEKNVDISLFLNLMDGIAAKNGLLVVATANDMRKLKTSITDRPSRFDRKFEIPLPTQEMAYIYLKKWFGNSISVKKCRELSKCAEKYDFSYAYLKELYISSMFESLSNNRKNLLEKDVDVALSILIKDKNLVTKGKSLNTDKYFNK